MIEDASCTRSTATQNFIGFSSTPADFVGVSIDCFCSVLSVSSESERGIIGFGAQAHRSRIKETKMEGKQNRKTRTEFNGFRYVWLTGGEGKRCDETFLLGWARPDS